MRERRLKRDSGKWTARCPDHQPLSHMQLPSSSLVWEQGLSFADPVLWDCDPFPAHLLPNLRLKTWLITGVSHPSAVGREGSGNLCLQPGHGSNGKQHVVQFHKRTSSSPHPPSKPFFPSPGSRYPPGLWNGVVWCGRMKRQILPVVWFFCVLSLSFSFSFSFLSAPLISRKNFYFFTFLERVAPGLSGPPGFC